jgi:hypothetical protein
MRTDGQRSNTQNYYLAPRPFDPKTGAPIDGDSQFAWSREAIQAAKAYLKLQPAFPYIQDGLDLINGDFAKSTNASLSNAKTDLVTRNLRELNAAQTNLNIVPAIKTESQYFREQTPVLNNSYTYWYGKTFADRVIRKGWQYATSCGTGYVSIGYDSDYYGIRRGEICLSAHGPNDVLPLGLPHDHNIQQAYAITLRVPTPYHKVIRMFPDMADYIHPTRDALKSHGTVMAQSVKFASAVLKRFGPGSMQEHEPVAWADVDLYYIFIDDRTVNYSGKSVLMGDPGTSWSYLVPSVGDMILIGRDAHGKKHYRQAEPDDCLFYPYRRLMIVTDDAILTPDPVRQVNKGWHGKVPIVQFRADDWPWLFLGFPLPKSGMLLEKANIEILRAIVDAMNVRLSPPTGYDRNTMARSLAETMNLRIPNQRVGLDYTLGGEQFRPLLPVEFYNVPNNAMELIDSNQQKITHQMGVADAAALARARQIPAGDTTERILDALGPIVKDQSRNMEYSCTDLGDMWIPLCFQWWSARKRFQIFGDDGLVNADIDWNPGSMVPKDDQDFYGSYFEAARQHSSNFHYSIEPYSLHEMNSITRRLALMQAEKGGLPVSWWTKARMWGLRDFGPKPRVQDPTDPRFNREYETEFELWLAQKEIEARFAQAMGAGQQKGGQGRPNSNNSSPKLALKDGGSRSTVTTSK